MKPLLISLASLALGFIAARLLPKSSVNAGDSKGVKIPAHPLSRPSRSLDIKGNWKRAAQASATEDPAGLCAWQVQRGIPPQSDLLSVLFTTWAVRDTDTALTACFNLPSDFRRRDMVLSDMLLAIFNKPNGYEAILKWLPQVDEALEPTPPGSELLREPILGAAQFGRSPENETPHHRHSSNCNV